MLNFINFTIHLDRNMIIALKSLNLSGHLFTQALWPRVGQNGQGFSRF